MAKLFHVLVFRLSLSFSHTSILTCWPHETANQRAAHSTVLCPRLTHMRLFLFFFGCMNKLSLFLHHKRLKYWHTQTKTFQTAPSLTFKRFSVLWSANIWFDVQFPTLPLLTHGPSVFDRSPGISSSLQTSVTVMSTQCCQPKNSMEHRQIMASVSRYPFFPSMPKEYKRSRRKVLILGVLICFCLPVTSSYSPQSVAQPGTWSCFVQMMNRPGPAGSQPCAC